MGTVLTYTRAGGGERLAVALNVGSEAAACPIGAGTVVAGTHPGRGRALAAGTLVLRPDEGVVVLMDGVGSAVG